MEIHKYLKIVLNNSTKSKCTQLLYTTERCPNPSHFCVNWRNSNVAPWQILSRVKPAVGGETAVSISEKKKKNKTKVPSLEEYLQQRDYLGAFTLLEVRTVHSQHTLHYYPLVEGIRSVCTHAFRDYYSCLARRAVCAVHCSSPASPTSELVKCTRSPKAQ